MKICIASILALTYLRDFIIETSLYLLELYILRESSFLLSSRYAETSPVSQNPFLSKNSLSATSARHFSAPYDSWLAIREDAAETFLHGFVSLNEIKV